MSKNRFPSPYGFTISVWLAVKIDAILFEACVLVFFSLSVALLNETLRPFL